MRRIEASKVQGAIRPPGLAVPLLQVKASKYTTRREKKGKGVGDCVYVRLCTQQYTLKWILGCVCNVGLDVHVLYSR